MHLKFLDPEITAKLLEGHRDALTPASVESEKFYSAQTCVRCGGSCRKTGDSRTMHTSNDIVPRFYLECLACGCEFNPHNGMIIGLGNIAKAVEPAIPILKTEND